MLFLSFDFHNLMQGILYIYIERENPIRFQIGIQLENLEI